MGDPFQVRIRVRGYELDTQGHVNRAVYLQYAEHVRRELLLVAGITQDTFSTAGLGPAALEVTVRFMRELRRGDEIDVTCDVQLGRRQDLP